MRKRVIEVTHNQVKVACCVILYLPSRSALDHINSLPTLFDRIIVVDNTDLSRIEYDIPKTSKSVIYIRLGSNLGIAYALNVAANKAIFDGYDWLLTLDQDSQINSAFIKSMTSYFRCIDLRKLGLIAPVQISKPNDIRNYKSSFSEILTTMTSGSFLNLVAYQNCGAFEELLFIDHVDHEYCLRLHAKGFKVIQCNHIVLTHSLGEVKEISLLGYSTSITTHKPFRLYYFTRNGFYVAQKYIFRYPQFAIFFMAQMFKRLVKIMFYEEDKLNRLRFICAGVKDFLHKRYGRYIQ